jgi:glyoxylase-like metal-dependent hydrolase (beta-lactamase superfamily II)
VKKLMTMAVLCLGLAPLALAQSFDITEVAPGVFAAIGRAGVASNGAFIINKDDVLVVDTHYRPSWARDLIAEIKKRTDKPVRYVVNTHWHNDHTQGNQAYVNAFGNTVEYIAQHAAREDLMKKGIPAVASAMDPAAQGSVPGLISQIEKLLADGKDRQGNPLTEEGRTRFRTQLASQKAYLEELKFIQVTLPTLTFEKSITLFKTAQDGSDRTIQVLYFGRGHTRGDVVIYLPKERVVITGDLLTGGVPFARDSYPSLWAGTLENVQKLDFTQVIPGHGGVQQGKQRLELTIALMKELVAHVQAGIGKGLTAEQLTSTTGFDSAKYDASFPNARAAMVLFINRAYAEATGKIPD